MGKRSTMKKIKPWWKYLKPEQLMQAGHLTNDSWAEVGLSYQALDLEVQVFHTELDDMEFLPDKNRKTVETEATEAGGRLLQQGKYKSYYIWPQGWLEIWVRKNGTVNMETVTTDPELEKSLLGGPVT